MATIRFEEGMQGLRQVSLFDLRTDLFPNPRQTNTREAIATLRDNIANQGLLQAPVMCRLPDSKEGLAAGFSRVDAIRQLAVMPLFNEVNKANGTTKKTDPGYLDVSEPEHQKKVRELKPKEWEKALKETMIPVVVKDIETPQEAALVGFNENVTRTDFSVRDLTRQIVGFLSGPNALKAKTLAIKMGCGEPKISQWRRVGELEHLMRVLLVTPQEGESLTEQEMADLRNTVKLCVDDYVERLGKVEPDQQAITFTAARNLAYFIDPKDAKKKPTRKNALRALQHLLGWSFSTSSLPENRRSADTSSWQMLTEADAKSVKDAAAAATAEANKPESEEVSGEEVTAETAVGETTPSATTQGAAAATAANAAAAGTAAPAAAAGTTSTASTEGGTETPATEVATDNAPPRKTKAGQEMPESNKYAKAFTSTAMEGHADYAYEAAAGKDLRFSESVGYLYAASAVYEVLGLSEKQKIVDRVVDAFSEEQEDYVAKLESIVLAAKTANLPLNKGVSFKDVLDADGKPNRPKFEIDEDTDGGNEIEGEDEGEEVEAEAATA